jgi:hypothetical protein
MAINPKTSFADIQREISAKTAALHRIHEARMAVHGYTTKQSALFTLREAVAGHRTFRLLAQGDSWFDIVSVFIDAFNSMLQDVAARFRGRVFYVDLRKTLTDHDQWANELHPSNDGFTLLAAKLDAAMQANI